MNKERNHKWLPALFFMLTGVIFGVSFYLITSSAVESEARAHGGNGAPATTTTAAPPKTLTTGTAPPASAERLRVVLRKDLRNSFGKVDLIYRGVAEGKLALDVFIRELDPDYPYRREIDYRSAKDGFLLGGVRFKLISAGNTKAKLVWIRSD